EIMGKDAEAMKSYYSEMFGWEIDSDNPINYGIVRREANLSAEGIGIGGGVGGGHGPGHVTFYVEVPDVDASLAKAESLGGARPMGPGKGNERLEIGLFAR